MCSACVCVYVCEHYNVHLFVSSRTHTGMVNSVHKCEDVGCTLVNHNLDAPGMLPKTVLTMDEAHFSLVFVLVYTVSIIITTEYIYECREYHLNLLQVRIIPL